MEKQGGTLNRYDQTTINLENLSTLSSVVNLRSRYHSGGASQFACLYHEYDSPSHLPLRVFTM